MGRCRPHNKLLLNLRGQPPHAHAQNLVTQAFVDGREAIYNVAVGAMNASFTEWQNKITARDNAAAALAAGEASLIQLQMDRANLQMQLDMLLMGGPPMP